MKITAWFCTDYCVRVLTFPSYRIGRTVNKRAKLSYIQLKIHDLKVELAIRGSNSELFLCHILMLRLPLSYLRHL